MDAIEERILSYPHLSVEEQREIEAYVESHPKWAPLLQEVRTLEGLVTEMRETLPSEGLLATYVVVQHLHPEEVPPALERAFSELEVRLSNDEDLRQRVEAARQRLREAEAALDPASHFEELSGRGLEEERGSEDRKAPERAAERRASGTTRHDTSLNLPTLARGVALAVVLLGGLYGGLYVISFSTQSTLDQLGAIEVSDEVMESYAPPNTRGRPSDIDTVSADARYLEALSALQSARTTTLGLFPRYDTDQLARAEGLLQDVVDQVPPESFLALEAHFYLGKVDLVQGDLPSGRTHLETVVERQGRRAEEARDILTTLQQAYPEGEASSAPAGVGEPET